METLQIINLVVAILNAGVVFLISISKPFRSWVAGSKRRKQKEEEILSNQKETDKCLLRDRITSIYFKNVREGQIKAYEFENVGLLYHQYKKLGGNSFVDKIWDEINEWEVIS